MVKEIVKDPEILKIPCSTVLEDDPELNTIIQDLIDTANAYKDECIGLAANQIGYNKRVIIIRNKDSWLPFINPRIIKREGRKFKSSEKCLSFDDERVVTRNSTITIMFQDQKGKYIKRKIGLPLSIVFQHEIGHLDGELI